MIPVVLTAVDRSSLRTPYLPLTQEIEARSSVVIPNDLSLGSLSPTSKTGADTPNRLGSLQAADNRRRLANHSFGFLHRASLWWEWAAERAFVGDICRICGCKHNAEETQQPSRSKHGWSTHLQGSPSCAVANHSRSCCMLRSIEASRSPQTPLLVGCLPNACTQAASHSTGHTGPSYFKLTVTTMGRGHHSTRPPSFPPYPQ
jgi:hypothetical protein